MHKLVKKVTSSRSENVPDTEVEPEPDGGQEGGGPQPPDPELGGGGGGGE